MKHLMPILILLILLPRTLVAGKDHAEQCLVQADHHVSMMQHAGHNAAAQHENCVSDHGEAHHHHEPLAAAETTESEHTHASHETSAPVESSFSADCEHCGDCHDHCGAMMMATFALSFAKAPHDLAVTPPSFFISSRLERIVRPPRLA